MSSYKVITLGPEKVRLRLVDDRFVSATDVRWTVGLPPQGSEVKVGNINCIPLGTLKDMVDKAGTVRSMREIDNDFRLKGKKGNYSELYQDMEFSGMHMDIRKRKADGELPFKKRLSKRVCPEEVVVDTLISFWEEEKEMVESIKALRESLDHFANLIEVDAITNGFLHLCQRMSGMKRLIAEGKLSEEIPLELKELNITTSTVTIKNLIYFTKEREKLFYAIVTLSTITSAFDLEDLYLYLMGFYEALKEIYTRIVE